MIRTTSNAKQYIKPEKASPLAGSSDLPPEQNAQHDSSRRLVGEALDVDSSPGSAHVARRFQSWTGAAFF